MIQGPAQHLELEIVSDPQELAALQPEREQWERNLAWFREHAAEIYKKHRGKCLCVAGQEVFVADSSPEAIALAKQAHPDDQGWFVRYVPQKNVPRIYAHRR